MLVCYKEKKKREQNRNEKKREKEGSVGKTQQERKKKGKAPNCGKEISDLRNPSWSRIWNLLKLLREGKGFLKRFPKPNLICAIFLGIEFGSF